MLFFRVLQEAGVDAFTTGNIPLALRHLTRAVTVDPSYADAYFNLGVAHMKAQARPPSLPPYSPREAVLPCCQDHLAAASAFRNTVALRPDDKASPCHALYTLPARQSSGPPTLGSQAERRHCDSSRLRERHPGPAPTEGLGLPRERPCLPRDNPLIPQRGREREFNSPPHLAW
jgi:tetratricopeptide (TPR) repeat protein